MQTLDYEGCRELFAADVVGYGTRAFVAQGLDALERHQWREVWPTIAGFRFAAGELRFRAADGLVALSVPFDSRAVDADGDQWPRPGRATIVLAEDGDRLLAVHTHFSLAPA